MYRFRIIIFEILKAVSIRHILFALFVFPGFAWEFTHGQIPIIDIATNQESALWSIILFLDDDEEPAPMLAQYELSELQDLLINDDLPFLIAKSNGYKYIVFKPGLFRRQRELMRVIHQDKINNYFLLCPKIVDDICDCGTDLYFYLPVSNKLKSVQKPFSFSLKRNLTKLLKNKFNIYFDENQYNSTCDLLKLLDSSK